MTTGPCHEPFDAAGPRSELCRICWLSPLIGGLRRWSRIVAESPAMRALLTRTTPIAATDSSVVILGESGTGKDTHRDPADQVQRGAFREDLYYYRLKVFCLVVPPLRERVEDIYPLTRMSLDNLGRSDARVQPATRTLLEAHRWPGNVRELSNAVEHGVALAQGGDIAPEHLPDDVIHPAPSRGRPGLMRTLADVEREHVIRVLEACGGRQVEAAHILGIGRNTLWRKLRGYGIEAVE